MHNEHTILNLNINNKQISLAKGDVVFLLGIGGIGMSALARYFNENGLQVYGYDKTRTSLTDKLEGEGIKIFFIDSYHLMPNNIKLIIYTPAVPKTNNIFSYCLKQSFEMFKRSEILGSISENYISICVAGTHGKTTMSSCLSHVLTQTGHPLICFLGGITTNYNSNYWQTKNSKPKYLIAEADEYDRSFLKLKPFVSFISSTDADHLEIYGNQQSVQFAFQQFASLTNKDGFVLVQKNIYHLIKNTHNKVITYSANDINADIYCNNIVSKNGKYSFTVYINNTVLGDFELELGGRYNIENCLPVIYTAHFLNIPLSEIQKAIASFKGVKRRFEIKTNHPLIVIDDYAHHPNELRSLINGVKEKYSNKKLLTIFQPHLYSRTNDFKNEFAEALSISDDIILLPIYPARELPMPGVTSYSIKNLIKGNYNSAVMEKDEAITWINGNKQKLINNEYVLVCAGAGDIDEWIDNRLLKAI